MARDFILVINKSISLPLRGRPILFITCTIADRRRLDSSQSHYLYIQSENQSDSRILLLTQTTLKFGAKIRELFWQQPYLQGNDLPGPGPTYTLYASGM